MYFSVRFTSPATDPQQAQQQRIMAFISPAMIGYLGIKYAWPSALILYWLSFNVFTMGQQLYLIRKYHRNPAAVGPHPEGEQPAAATAALGAAANGTAPGAVALKSSSNGGGSRSARRRRSSRR
jgi:YidC/Oxa1 family membrane protein insertase